MSFMQGEHPYPHDLFCRLLVPVPVLPAGSSHEHSRRSSTTNTARSLLSATPVSINHPDRNLPLLKFPALFTGPSPTTPYGVFRPLVLDACRVLTNHASNTEADGDYLASDIEGSNRVEINDTPLAFDRCYFLGAPDAEAHRNYPIVNTLSAFAFPAPLPER
uniref:Transcriptional repressor rco-1 n=1 Tax=Ganoderma boninense TaxID=34458 RepID=A0A5K1K7P4_9APHY|nr:Transcriptional repressor rco-1 [Ganoderma boninense]